MDADVRVLGATLLLLTGGCTPREPVDLVLHNGVVFTADEAAGLQSAVAIRGARIVAVGGEEVLGRVRAERVIDLRGRLVTPGFNDSHIHITGFPQSYVDLAHAQSITEIQELVRRKAAELGPGEWVTGMGWAEGLVTERRPPFRADLDAAAPGNPVVLARAGGHSIVANSRALELAGIDEGTRDPEGGIIERGTDGRLNGVIRERLDLVLRLVPPGSPDELRASLIRNLKDLFELGITSINVAGVSPADFATWESLYGELRGDLPRASLQIFPGLQSGGASVEEALASLRSLGKKTGDGDEWLRVGAVKLWVDGGFAGPAAWTLEPYPGQPTYFGLQNISGDDLYTFTKAAHDEGWQCGYHAIGDAAIQLAVDVFARVLDESPRPDHRHYLNHFTVLPPAETLEKTAHYGILISQQPNFTWSPTLESRYVENLAGEKLERNNSLRTPISHGIFVALGSDNHPIGPMPGLYGATTRRGASGRVYAEDERLTMAEAITAYTRNSAYITREEGLKGTIEPGRLADLVVLSRNLLEVAPEDILGTEVLITVLGGKVVFERGEGES